MTGLYTCDCTGNTAGPTCSHCDNFYNNLPYERGDDGFTCAACDCHNHSTSCAYSAAAANSSNDGSGGVCLACAHNTTGAQCDECVDLFYRPRGVNASEVDACRPCECHVAGIRLSNVSGAVFGDCLQESGDCNCKSNVTGSKCDQCRPGYYNLSADNPDGCQPCNCFADGTVDGSDVCNDDSTGQCPCKNFTEGRQCDSCMDGYYGLDGALDAGCLPCDCDPGGSSDSVCDKVAGKCQCAVNNVDDDRTCSRNGIDVVYYYRDVHSIRVEAEGSATHNQLNPRWGFSASALPEFTGRGYAILSAGVRKIFNF